MVKITGRRQVRDRFKRLASVDEIVAAALFEGGHAIEAEAKRSIVEGSISGVGHVPSLPGEPPNADTRRLDTAITTELVSVVPPRVNVISSAPYSAALEFGTSKMEERPYMRPAAANKLEHVTDLVANALRGRV